MVIPVPKIGEGKDPAAEASCPIEATLGTAVTSLFDFFLGEPAAPDDAVFLPIAKESKGKQKIRARRAPVLGLAP